MSFIFLLILCITSLQNIYAGDSDSEIHQAAVGALAASSHDLPAEDDVEPPHVVLDMKSFGKSLAQRVPHPLLADRLKGSKVIAHYITQVAHGTTSTKPSHLTPHIYTILKRLKQDDPIRHAQILNDLTEHRDLALSRSRLPKRGIRGIADDAAAPDPEILTHDPEALGSALQQGVPASVVQLITSASKANDAQHEDTIAQRDETIAQRDGTLAVKAATITQQRWQFGIGMALSTLTTLVVAAAYLLQTLHVTA